MSIDLSKNHITSRDYNSIYQELIDTIPNISQSWKSTEESDPGIVLTKLIAILGDMLSYNHDRAVLESYPATVLQRKNAAQIFRLIGYKMHWYQASTCLVTITNLNVGQITIEPLSTFSTLDNSITYTNMEEIIIAGNASETVELIQGTPLAPYKIVPQVDINWHSKYAYNVLVSDIIDNKIYIEGNNNIDESHILLIDNNGDTWTQVNDLNLATNINKYFEFDIDSQDKPYIKLADYWANYEVTMFKLFYILTKGSDGQILENTLVNFISSEDTLGNSDISILNDLSTIGKNPETADEARIESAKYVNTYSTLITLSDFTKAVKRIDGVANCIATDKTTDPDGTNMEDYDINIYVTPEETYIDSTEVDPAVLAADILEELRLYKLMPLDVQVITATNESPGTPCIYEYTWNLGATIYLKEPVTLDTSHNIIVKINNLLKAYYNVNRINYNAVLSISNLINVIMSVDPLVYNIDLDYIKYYDYNGTEVTKEDVTGSYSYKSDTYSLVANGEGVYEVALSKTTTDDIDDTTFEMKIIDDEANESIVTAGTPTNDISTLSATGDLFVEGTLNVATGDLDFEVVGDAYYNIIIKYKLIDSGNTHYTFILPHKPIKPGTVYIRLQNGNYIINDDLYGVLNSQSTIFNSGDIDYVNGIINIELMDTIPTDYIIDYNKNVINIAKFLDVDITKLRIANDSIKR